VTVLCVYGDGVLTSVRFTAKDPDYSGCDESCPLPYKDGQSEGSSVSDSPFILIVSIHVLEH
jgi:hypothetical protein